MMDLAGVRTAIAGALDTIPGLRAYAFVPDKPEPPCAIVAPSGCDYDQTMARGSDEILFTVVVLASRADDRSGQGTLDGYLAADGASSVKAAIEADTDLAGTVDTVRVRSWQTYGVREWAGIAYYSVEFTIEVIG